LCDQRSALKVLIIETGAFMATNQGDPMAAQLLGVSASAYAAYATDRLFEKVPEARVQFGESAFSHWKAHFSERIKELSAAIAEQEPALFVSRVRWSRAAFQAREVSVDLLRESLACLNEVLQEELPTACRDVPAKYLMIARESFDESNHTPDELDSDDPVTKLAMQYLLKILEGDGGNAIKMVVDAHTQGLSIEDAYRVLMLAQREIGRMWHQAEINIAEEHVVTSTTERAMSVLAYHANKAASNGLTVVSAAVAGNAHDIGVRLVSDFFEFAGWRAICLGSDLPAAETAQAVQFFDSSLVLLSASLTTQLTAVRETIQAIRAVKPDCKIMVGGTALHDTPGLWSQLGADAYAASPTDAVETGTRLVNP
jgi:methanogenic corrinoid protein MtbC1